MELVDFNQFLINLIDSKEKDGRNPKSIISGSHRREEEEGSGRGKTSYDCYRETKESVSLLHFIIVCNHRI